MRALQFKSTMPVCSPRTEAKKSLHLPKPALFTSTLISGLFSFKSCSITSRLSSFARSREMVAMVLSVCSSATLKRASLLRAIIQKESTLGYCSIIALIYSFPSPEDAPVISAVTIKNHHAIRKYAQKGQAYPPFVPGTIPFSQIFRRIRLVHLMHSFGKTCIF